MGDKSPKQKNKQAKQKDDTKAADKKRRADAEASKAVPVGAKR